MAKSKKAVTQPQSVDVFAVFWTDAVLSEDGDHPFSPIPAVTFGVMREVEPNYVTVAGEMFADTETRLVTSVPASMGVRVVKVGTLKIPKEFWAWRTKHEPK